MKPTDYTVEVNTDRSYFSIRLFDEVLEEGDINGLYDVNDIVSEWVNGYWELKAMPTRKLSTSCYTIYTESGRQC